MSFASVISLLRVRQWIKNTFVFLPAFFGGVIFDRSVLLLCACAFAAFCFAASAIYCINDIRDAEADRLHPCKRNRPVASGEVSPAIAAVMAVLLACCAVALPLFCGQDAGAAIIGVYLLINLAYCFGLKQAAVVDVFIIALGFVLRVVAGGVMSDVWLSPWIVCMTFLLALFLAFAKRRDDVVLRETQGLVTRKNTTAYNLPFLNLTLGLLASVTIVCYVIYCLSPEVEARFGTDYVYVTAVFVLAGVLRYMQISMVESRSGSPTETLLHDRFLQLCIVLWLISFVVIIYFPVLCLQNVL
ncbi:MAG: decaprenyl-phosphate phosphoribosyltransferase [Muribaculaceae bacterium]|nr:decaprenyl-phosphate phosphoribosyltransferase [Muribaculaceae bacterium]